MMPQPPKRRHGEITPEEPCLSGESIESTPDDIIAAAIRDATLDAPYDAINDDGEDQED
ncbi:hypothetical protein [Chitinophaga vietnamensis]|uniref:hypothetical protein n=1 Tax=Chitinophaga vietnamensis TaxID=2593957 RepID=UPI0013763465|nr:hypothetical protein [Chitinophaga vietnamensis]